MLEHTLGSPAGFLGRLWTSAHSKGLALSAHTKNSSQHSPETGPVLGTGNTKEKKILRDGTPGWVDREALMERVDRAATGEAQAPSLSELAQGPSWPPPPPVPAILP